MADTDAVSETLRIDAPAAVVLDVVSDFAAYPDWLAEFKDAEVLAAGDDGRAQQVRFTVGAVGISLSFTLDYTYEPARISWRLLEGDMLHRLDGAYVLDGDDPTRLTYELEVESSVPLPGMVRRRVAGKIVKDSLKAIRSRAEGRAA